MFYKRRGFGQKAVQPTEPLLKQTRLYLWLQAQGRSYSHSPPSGLPFRGQTPASASSSPRISRASKGYKRLSPWEAASRHPLGLVDEAFPFQDLQQDLVSNVHSAAQRKSLPEPPAEWKARVSSQAPQRAGTWSPIRSQGRASLPFGSPTRSPVFAPIGYRSLPRQWQLQRPPASNLGSAPSYPVVIRPVGMQQAYKTVYTSNTSWRR